MKSDKSAIAGEMANNVPSMMSGRLKYTAFEVTVGRSSDSQQTMPGWIQVPTLGLGA